MKNQQSHQNWDLNLEHEVMPSIYTAYTIKYTHLIWWIEQMIAIADTLQIPTHLHKPHHLHPHMSNKMQFCLPQHQEQGRL